MAKAKKLSKKKSIDSSFAFPNDDSSINTINEDLINPENNYSLKWTTEENDGVQTLVSNSEEEISTKVAPSSDDFSFAKPIYLQIHLGNIYSIFGSAIIAPANTIRNRAFDDIQTNIQMGFILSNGFIELQNESTALLTINFGSEDLIDLIIQDSVAFCYVPIPISRIKNIHVANQKLKQEIISTALSNDGGVISNLLVTDSFPENLPIYSFVNGRNITTITDYSIGLNHYDKILGTFAYLKNYSFLLANRTLTLSPLPDHYFFAAQALYDIPNFQIRRNDRAVSFYRQLLKGGDEIDNPLLNWLFKRVNINKNFSDDDVLEFGNLIIKTAKDNEFIESSKDILNSLTKSLERKNALSKISELNNSDKFSLYLFAVLRIYANINTENKSIARADLPELIALSYGEYVFAILGYFFGYKVLRNFDEKIGIEDGVLAKYVDLSKRIPIKFENDTTLDYVIIESAYRVAFKADKSAIDFEVFKSHSITKEYSKKPGILPSDYTFTSVEVFGKNVYQLRRKSISEEIYAYLNQMPDEIPAISDLGAFCYRNNLPMYFSNLLGIINKTTAISLFNYFKKDDVLLALKGNKFNLVELKQRIDLSKQFKTL